MPSDVDVAADGKLLVSPPDRQCYSGPQLEPFVMFCGHSRRSHPLIGPM